MKTINQDLAIVYDVFAQVLEQSGSPADVNLPVFSFEGLPGAGKTTQIEHVSAYLEAEFGKSHFIDLPTDSPIGLLLKSLYQDPLRWKQICTTAPWLNGLLITIDFRMALARASFEGARFALMSRGILSTYYYNWPMFRDFCRDDDHAWSALTQTLRGFVNPSAILFFELSPDVAHQRVAKRARGPLRKMDQVENMVSDRRAFEQLLNNVAADIPVYYINSDQSERAVTVEAGQLLGDIIRAWRQ